MPKPRTEGAIAAWQVLETLREITGGDAIVTTEVGQNQMWTAQHYKVEEPRRFVTSGGLGTMGFGFPAAIGAAFACPRQPVCCVAGDGSLMMNIQELDTCARYDIPVKIILLNNVCLGNVRMWQELFYNKRYSDTVYTRDPDFVKISEGMGVKGMKASRPEEIRKTLEDALAHKGPVLVDFQIPQEDEVFPMVVPGTPLDKMLFEF